MAQCHTQIATGVLRNDIIEKKEYTKSSKSIHSFNLFYN